MKDPRDQDLYDFQDNGRCTNASYNDDDGHDTFFTGVSTLQEIETDEGGEDTGGVWRDVGGGFQVLEVN